MNQQSNDNKREGGEQRSRQDAGVTSQLLQPHLLAGYHERGYLPHLKVEGGTYWVTFRLHDSLPQEVLSKLEGERKAWEKQQASKKTTPKELAQQWQRLYSKRMQAYLDAGMGACWLKRDDIGGLVAKAIRFFEGSRYDLHAWVVMPNHGHVMVTPRDKWTLSSILHICEYTINNPVSAGLCAKPEDWKFSSAFAQKDSGAISK